MLLSCIHDNVYSVQRSVFHPALPKDKTYDELITALRQKYATNVLRKRREFYRASQAPTESIKQWAYRIEVLAEDCMLKKNDEVTVAQFISGLQSDAILTRISEIPDIELRMFRVQDLITNLEVVIGKADEDAVEIVTEHVSNIEIK